MEPVLMFTDTKQLNERIAEHSLHLGALNAVLAAYELMKLPKLSEKEFISLVQQPATVVFDKMTNGTPVEIMGMQVNKVKAMELLVKPAGYNELIDAIEAYRKTPNWHLHLAKADVINNEVILHQNVIDAETKSSKVYAKTEKEKQLFQFVQAVITAANEAFGEGNEYNLAELIDTTIKTHAIPAASFLMAPKKHFYQVNYKNIVGFGTEQFHRRVFRP